MHCAFTLYVKKTNKKEILRRSAFSRRYFLWARPTGRVYYRCCCYYYYYYYYYYYSCYHYCYCYSRLIWYP